jgi:hypothetical protein
MVKLDGYNTEFFKSHSITEHLADLTEDLIKASGKSDIKLNLDPNKEADTPQKDNTPSANNATDFMV